MSSLPEKKIKYLLIRLFQHATICSVGACRGPFSEEFARVSASIRDRRGLPGLPGGVSLARRVRVSTLRDIAARIV